MRNISRYRNKVNNFIAERNTTIIHAERLREKIKTNVQKLSDHDEARNLIQIAAEATQKQLEQNISSVVTLAIASIFENNPYEFKVDFTKRRNKTECDLLFVRNKKEMAPLDSSGYGAADVASLALRVSYWLFNPTRPSILWDEPFRQLSEDNHTLTSDILKKISDEKKIQFIIATHQNELIKSADKLFNVALENDISIVN